MKRLVAIALLVAGCSGAGATPIPVYVTPKPAASAAAEPPASTPAPVADNAAKLGEAVPIINNADNSHVGDVTVLTSKKYPQGYNYQSPTTGHIFLAVEVVGGMPVWA